MTLPRLLVIMGSGETAPTMKGPHREVFARLGAGSTGAGSTGAGQHVDAVMLDTPFGFQENAPTLAATTVKYFRDSVGREVTPIGMLRTDTGDRVAVESALAAVRGADWVFAGPGSPTYALRQWRPTGLADLLADKLRTGGAVVFSSAAALTLGVVTVPVYEVYKAGIDPWWEPGLDLLGPLGISAAVIPHYDNAEGGHHDTRFCYLGERRLSMLEPELPAGAFVLGVDEHTGVIIDLDADTATVVGKGGLTLRRAGHSVRFETGSVVPLDTVRAGGDGAASLTPAAAETPADTQADSPADTQADSLAGSLADSLEGATAECERRFTAALAGGDAHAAVAAILELDAAVEEWSADTLQSDQTDRARAALRSMIVRLGAAASEGLRDPREVVGPVVEAALDARRVARQEKAYAVSDALRDGLDRAGVEVRDTADGVEWLLRSPT